MKSKYYWLIALTSTLSVTTFSGFGDVNQNKEKSGRNIQSNQLLLEQKQKQTGHKHHHGFKALFHAIDSNKDRQISLAEVHEMLKYRFLGLDVDGDGHISLDEFSNRHLSMFSAVDKNNDGLITREEMKQHRREKHRS